MEVQLNGKISNESKFKAFSVGNVNSCIYALLLVIFVKIIYEFTFFSPNSKVSLGITALLSVITMLGVLSVFKFLGGRLQILWIIFVLSVLISYLTHLSGLEYICNTFTFLGTMSLLKYSKLSKKSIRNILLVFAIFVLMLFIFASRFGGRSNLIDLNTNTSGIIICLFEISVIALSRLYGKNAVMKYVCYTFAIVSLIFQLQFASRSSLLGTLILLFYIIFSNIIHRMKTSTFSKFVWLLSIGSIIFAYFYAVVLFNAIGHGKIIIMGKDIFSGRQTIWSQVFERLSGHWLFGVGNLGVNDTTVHNQMLGYTYCFGIFVTIFFISLLSELLKNLSYQKSRFLTVSVMIFLVISVFETLIYSSYNIAFVVICIIMTYTCDKIYTQRERKNG